MTAIKAIVTDIEGTTSSLSFVKDVLFPYAREHIGDYLRVHCADPVVAELIADVANEAGRALNLDETIDQLVQWIDDDRKVTPLKSLQGLIWEAGYRNGSFYGHIYEDAWRNLRDWHADGLKLYVYSSGSVYAQKLLFAHTEYGDLTPLFSGYFDTHIGGKREAASYRRIVDELQIEPGAVLFLSDVPEELAAADEAGMRTCWLVRAGEPNSAAAYSQVSDFDQITLD